MRLKQLKIQKGFTLIELLIVIAIILILIAIALPNFLVARLRATVTQVKAELRSLQIAVESYATDWNSRYPISIGKVLRGASDWDRGPLAEFYNLSTPIAYVEEGFLKDKDPFYGDTGSVRQINYIFFNREQYAINNPSRVTSRNRTVRYLASSLGPDKRKGPDPRDGSNWANRRYQEDPVAPYFDPKFTAWNYSPTNGSRSNGDILLVP